MNEQDSVLVNKDDLTAGANASAVASNGEQSKSYKLDWETMDIKLAKGRFVHTVTRPATELILEREADLETEITIDKNSHIKLPDPTANEEVDARYLRKIRIEVKGYPEGSEIPERHEAVAFQQIYARVIEVDESCSPFDEFIIVNEEIGSGDEPDYVVKHAIRQPSEIELKNCRRRTSTGNEIKPGKRGRQVLVTKSNLKASMEFYKLWMTRIDGATVGGEVYSDELREQFLACVDPLIQKAVVDAAKEFFAGGLLD